MTSPTEQRRAFDAAMQRFSNGDPEGAREAFTRITEQNPAMSDAWVGRLACGDHSLAALAGAHTNSRALYRETRRVGLQDGSLQASVPAPLYLPIQVWSRGTIAVAYASGLIAAARYTTALEVLDDPELARDAQTAMWRQFVTAALHHKTRRWPDVCTVTDTCPPPTATYVPNDLLAATQTVRAMALAALGQFQASLDQLAQVSTQTAAIAADAALTRGWCLRELGDPAAADDAFRSATIDGQLIPQARQALDNPSYRIPTTDAETIATRTDKWDPATETSRSERAAAALADERRDVLADAQARIDELIGLENIKEQVAVWRTEKQIEQLLIEQGEEVSASDGDHMIFEGPPGTAKTTIARIVAEVLFGLGKLERPDVKEVSEADIVVGYISQTATRMREVCEEALGGVLFIDEAYTLVPETEGHSFGKEAIDTLLKFMEDHRDKFVVIAAGYVQPMRRFLRANEGFASRFGFTLTFSSYAPEEIVQIAQLIARKDRLSVDPAAWEVLGSEAAQLLAVPSGDGTMLDVAGNGRYARKVVGACKSERARRLYRAAPLPQDLEQLVRADPAALKVNVDDMQRALAQARPAT
ncbi:type VII secretion system ESX-1 AAA family ATPase EccA1 [Mycobacterium avium subsp. hominissuis]|uniref:AAA family ATPase n=1 Tax=Mycobacterium avium TaxID=1764 RepID=UPI000A01195C|nr:AAA family ATPase [Mycobacterium avium]PBA42284.1 ATPase [Mycobacterium avium]PBA86004.1 ATPase [Mycobacterium avium]